MTWFVTIPSASHLVSSAASRVCVSPVGGTPSLSVSKVNGDHPSRSFKTPAAHVETHVITNFMVVSMLVNGIIIPVLMEKSNILYLGVSEDGAWSKTAMLALPRGLSTVKTQNSKRAFRNARSEHRGGSSGFWLQKPSNPFLFLAKRIHCLT